MTGEGPLVVREKTHAATAMTLDQALYEMELVGHDFYLYVDKDTDRPCVVYRRRGYDYGVISLDLQGVGAGVTSPMGCPCRYRPFGLWTPSARGWRTGPRHGPGVS